MAYGENHLDHPSPEEQRRPEGMTLHEYRRRRQESGGSYLPQDLSNRHPDLHKRMRCTWCGVPQSTDGDGSCENTKPHTFRLMTDDEECDMQRKARWGLS